MLWNRRTIPWNGINSIPLFCPVQQIKARVAHIQEIRRLERKKDGVWGRTEKKYGLITFINCSTGQSLHKALPHSIFSSALEACKE